MEGKDQCSLRDDQKSTIKGSNPVIFGENPQNYPSTLLKDEAKPLWCLFVCACVWLSGCSLDLPDWIKVIIIGSDWKYQNISNCVVSFLWSCLTSSEFVFSLPFYFCVSLNVCSACFSRLTQQGEPVSCQWSWVPGSGCVYPHEQNVRWSTRLHRWLGWRASLQRWWTHRKCQQHGLTFSAEQIASSFSPQRRVKSVGFCCGSEMTSLASPR